MILPIQPIKDNRFVENKIVSYLLDNGGIDMNKLAVLPFTDAERVQFAQLIGYSVSGFSTLSYVDDEAYAVASKMEDAPKLIESNARNAALREQLAEIKRGLKIAAVEAFRIHEDDLN